MQFPSLKKAEKTHSIAIEYVAPHWVVLIQNPGQKEWTALRSTTKFVEVPNEFGDIVRTYPAIETFLNKAAAEAWVTEHMGDSSKQARKNSEIEKFLSKAASPVQYA